MIIAKNKVICTKQRSYVTSAVSHHCPLELFSVMISYILRIALVLAIVPAADSQAKKLHLLPISPFKELIWLPSNCTAQCSRDFKGPVQLLPISQINFLNL